MPTGKAEPAAGLAQILHQPCRGVYADVGLDQRLFQIVEELVIDLAAASDQLPDSFEKATEHSGGVRG